MFSLANHICKGSFSKVGHSHRRPWNRSCLCLFEARNFTHCRSNQSKLLAFFFFFPSGFEGRQSEVEPFPCELSPASGAQIEPLGVQRWTSGLLLPFLPPGFLNQGQATIRITRNTGSSVLSLLHVSWAGIAPRQGPQVLPQGLEKRDIGFSLTGNTFAGFPVWFWERCFLGRIHCTSLFCILTVNGV